MEIHCFFLHVFCCPLAHILFLTACKKLPTPLGMNRFQIQSGERTSWSLLSSQAHPRQDAQAELPWDLPPLKASCRRTEEWALTTRAQWSRRSYSTREGVLPMPWAGKLQKHLLEAHSAAHLSQGTPGGHCSKREGRCLYTTVQETRERQDQGNLCIVSGTA